MFTKCPLILTAHEHAKMQGTLTVLRDVASVRQSEDQFPLLELAWPPSDLSWRSLASVAVAPAALRITPAAEMMVPIQRPSRAVSLDLLPFLTRDKIL